VVWLWGSTAGSATTSTPIGKAMIPFIGPTRPVDGAKSGATDRLYRDTACADATAFGSHRFQARAADGLRKQARLPGGRTPSGGSPAQDLSVPRNDPAAARTQIGLVLRNEAPSITRRTSPSLKGLDRTS
jgi:hypothetical protein